MIEKIDPNQIQGFLEKSSSRQPDSANSVSDKDVDISLQADYVPLINKAMQIPQADARAVQCARELLLSGQLENPENIRAAAENIISFGV